MEGKALGKGLSALIPERKEVKQPASVMSVRTETVMDSSLQPRTNYDEVRLEELKNSIKDKGVLQPILVRKRQEGYEVIAGERRLKAARALGLEEIPVVVKDVSDREAFVIALIENIQREELNPIEEAEAFRKMIEDFNYTQEAVAESVGKDRSTITNLLRVLRLPPEMRRSIAEGGISLGHARALLSIDSPKERDGLYALIIKKGLSVRESESYVQSKNKTGSRRIKKQETKNRDVLALEEDLQKALGTKVRLMTSKKRGKIIIEYYSYDDLDRIIHLIKK